MSSLNQYIDLFKAQREAINRNAPASLNAGRDEALALLEEAGRLPERADEGYEKTSVEQMFAPDLGVNINRVNIPVNVADSFRCDVPNITTLLAVVVNDRFTPTATLLKNLPQGVTVCSLRDADPALVGKYLNRVAGKADVALAFNSLLLQDGVLIHVDRNVKVDKAIQIVNIFSSPAPMFAPRRVLVVAEEGAEVSILKCDHTQTAGTLFGSSEVVEIVAGSNARVDWYDLEESTPSTARWCQFRCRQEAHSSLNICGATLTNGTTRNDFILEVVGDGCETQLSGMAIGSGSQHIDNCSYLLHNSDHCQSNQLFKYVLDDNASGAFEGSIEVAHNARFNEAYQSNGNLLASEHAKMHSKPQLLIYNDDVKCSHGASTGQLDSSALFYMQSRGIPMAEARKMLMQAFMVDVVEKIRLENLRDRLRHLLEMRFSGACGDAACVGCRSNNL
jgi:Fe-S cluster assembly protein SufD